MNPDQIREAIEYLDACLRALHETAGADGAATLRDLTDEEQTQFDEGMKLRAKLANDLERHQALTDLAPVPERQEPGDQRGGFNVNKGTNPDDIARDRNATPAQLRDGVLKSLEGKVERDENMRHVEQVVARHLTPLAADMVGRDTREWARGLIQRSTPEYTTAFAKFITGRSELMTNEERAALAVGTNTQGGYLLPTHLDPTIILTNAGSTNDIRQLARVVTLTEGETWNGVTSAGVTASWDGELVEVSDDTPGVGRASVSVNVAQAFVQASIPAFEDIVGLQNDVMMMFADAKDRLEGTAFATGSGSGQPKGVFTAVHAASGSRVVSTTAATIGLVDIHGVYRTVPKRWRSKGSWMANPLYTLAVKALGSAVSASYSGDLREPVSTKWLDKPVYENDDAPTTQTTTALDDEILYGDFSQYLIVDKPGGMSVDFIPHLFNTSNNLPDGRRGWFAYWRTGGDALVTSAFALLVDKTSA